MTIEIAEYILLGLVAVYLIALFLFIGIEERKTNKKNNNPKTHFKKYKRDDHTKLFKSI